jgi:hypothetical protein
VTIAEQIATPTPAPRTRRPSSPLMPVPEPRRVRALIHVLGLLSVTALGAALFAGAVAIGIMMVASNLGG